MDGAGDYNGSGDIPCPKSRSNHSIERASLAQQSVDDSWGQRLKDQQEVAGCAQLRWREEQ